MPRLRRRWVLASVAAVVLIAVVIGIDVATRYLPAAAVLEDGAQALSQVRAGLGGHLSHVDGARLAAIDEQLSRAAADFGPRSSLVESGWLAAVGSSLPVVGGQVRALRTLRSAGAAATALGRDALPMLRALLTSPPAAESGLSRVVRVARSSSRALRQAVSDLDAFDAAVATLPPAAGLITPLAGARATVTRLAPVLDRTIRPAVDVLRALPAAIGSGTHRYLLLLDNPGEERPGGGFIGAVGEVTVSDGAVAASTFRSSDFANGLVPVRRAPRALDETLFRGKPLELSDSNWSPDFPTSAVDAATMYQQATGVAVDGVIGVDPVALSYVLAVTGPVSAPPYPQTVMAQNALLQLNQIINMARPGDPGKAYLAPFGARMLERILATPLSRQAELAAALVRGAREKHIVMSFTSTKLMARADAAGVTGRVADPASDSLQIVDANVGGNKADLFVGRRYDLVASVGAQGQVVDTLTLTYSNLLQSATGLAPLVRQYGGEYRDYVRVYVPETASLQSMSLRCGGVTAAVSPESVDFELHREAIGYVLVVPPGQTVALSLTYSGPFVDAAADPVRYELSWTKEIGASAWPVAVTVRAGGGEQHLSSDLTVDRRWSVIAG